MIDCFYKSIDISIDIKHKTNITVSCTKLQIQYQNNTKLVHFSIGNWIKIISYHLLYEKNFT